MGAWHTMLTDKPMRRLPLRDLLTDAEKRTRDRIDHLETVWDEDIADLRNLSRPLRKKSHYPTFLAIVNAIQKLVEGNQETAEEMAVLMHQLEMIHDHARRELLSRR
jgi:hypothetical protein